MSSNQIDQPSTIPDPMVVIAPEDADTAFVAGIQFARALAGVKRVTFEIALSEQEALVHAAIVESGFSESKAWTAGMLFKAGARREWRRITSPEWRAVWGTA